MNPHYSVSQMNTFWMCPMQWYHRYVLNLKIPPSVFMVIGKGGHKSIQKNLTNKIEKGVLLAESEVSDAARDAVNAEWDKETPMLSDEDKESEATTKGEAVDRAVSLSMLHHNVAAPEIRPIAVERKWELATPLGIDIIGVIDICEDEAAGWRIRDTKFKGKSPSDREVHQSIQFTGYHLALQVLDAHDCMLQMDALVQTKTKKYFKPMPTTRNNIDHQDLLNRMVAMHEAITKGVFLPCQRDHWACCGARCGYYDKCAYGRKGRERMTA